MSPVTTNNKVWNIDSDSFGKKPMNFLDSHGGN